MPLRREDELRRILQNITVARTCPPEAGIPLLIAADDEYVADMYAAMLKQGFGDAAMAEIDALSLTEADFAPGRENIFLRSLTETKSARTVFLISHCEALRPGETEELIKVLDVEYRRRFKLFHPPVSLDLSKLTFILLASEPSAAVRRLSAVSDTVWSARIDAAERPAVVQSMFRARAHAFGCAEVTVESGCCDLLTGYDTKQLQKIVDGALRAAIFEKRDTITPSAVRAIVEERNITAPRRGFGYTGGEYHA